MAPSGVNARSQGLLSPDIKTVRLNPGPPADVFDGVATVEAFWLPLQPPTAAVRKTAKSEVKAIIADLFIAVAPCPYFLALRLEV
jgi:hypothetical protein